MILLFESSVLLDALFASAVVSQIVILLVFLRKAGIEFESSYQGSEFARYIKRSLSLLVYNLSFYGLLLSIRAAAGVSLDTESFGQITLAINIAAGIAMIGGSLQFLISPNLIARFTNDIPPADLSNDVVKLTNSYLLFSAAIYVVSLATVLVFAPLYEPLLSVLVLCSVLFIAHHIYDHCFIAVTSLTSKGSESLLLIPAAFSYLLIGLALVVPVSGLSKSDPLVFAILLLAVYVVYLFLVALVFTNKLEISKVQLLRLLSFRFSAPAVVSAVLAVSGIQLWLVLLVWCSSVLALNLGRLRTLFHGFLDLAHHGQMKATAD